MRTAKDKYPYLINSYPELDMKLFVSLYLNECNRKVLHPIGVGLRYEYDRDTDKFTFYAVDSRKAPELLEFDMNFDEIFLDRVYDNFQIINAERLRCAARRKEKLGYIIQPHPFIED